jgi:hypothetical protein
MPRAFAMSEMVMPSMVMLYFRLGAKKVKKKEIFSDFILTENIMGAILLFIDQVNVVHVVNN